jgi:hypothetical protein
MDARGYVYRVEVDNVYWGSIKPVDARPEIMLGDAMDGWKKLENDYHFNHHRYNGANTLIEEINSDVVIPKSACFLTRKLTASVCAAAAWLQVLSISAETKVPSLSCNLPLIRRQLLAISYYGEIYELPVSEGLADLEVFSRLVVATFDKIADDVRAYFDLKPNPDLWTVGERMIHQSRLFQKFTEWLISAALGGCMWPGQGEMRQQATEQIVRYQMEEISLYDRFRALEGVAILDGRGYIGAINDRHLIEWARIKMPTANMTLTVRDRYLTLNCSPQGLMLPTPGAVDGESSVLPDLYIVGMHFSLNHVPMHPSGPPNYGTRRVWDKLTERECLKRSLLGIPRPYVGFEPRVFDYEGQSSPSEGMLLTIPEVVDIMKAELE